MERARLAEPEPTRELDDDEILEAVETLMRLNPRFKAAMAEVLRDTLIAKGEIVAINLGITFPPED
jgi:hypothetical protein